MPMPANQRKKKRVHQLKPTWIALKGAFFELNDVSSGGIGIVLATGAPEFVTGERLEDIPIELTTGPVSIQGVVSHISVSTGKTVCGIRFLLAGDDYDTVMQFKKEREIFS
jgi:c-di-GMP-binding flagellar brake protein YcgR